jgi:hypothetical protein
MFGGPAPTPAPPPLPDPLPSSPTYASGTNKPAGNSGNVGSYGGTIMTSPQGDLVPSNTSKKSLLGQ